MGMPVEYHPISPIQWGPLCVGVTGFAIYLFRKEKKENPHKIHPRISYWEEFRQAAFLDVWIHRYNNERTHQGKMCCGRTPMATFQDGKKVWKEKVDFPNAGSTLDHIA